MTSEIHITKEGWLIRPSFHHDCLKREILWENIPDLPREEDRDRFKNRYTKPSLEEWRKAETEEDRDAMFIRDMLGEYGSMKKGDRIFYYNDIRVLSGTAGYVHLRDGYIWGQKVEMIS